MIFVLFYVSLIVIIIWMYVKYRIECKEMAKNEGSEANFVMVKRLMEQYDQKQRQSTNSTRERLHSSRGPLLLTGSGDLRDTLPRESSFANRYSTLIFKNQDRKDLLGFDIKGQNVRLLSTKLANHLSENNNVGNASRLEGRIDDSFSQHGGDKSSDDVKYKHFKTNSLQHEKNSYLSSGGEASGEEVQRNSRFTVGPEHLKSSASGSLRRSNSSDQVTPSQTTSKRS